MPTVYNGVGTWYYGKKRIHRLKGVCAFCNRVGELESFDTTLFFVILFVPLVPLSRKRVLEKCPACNKHRVVSLKKWEELKAQAIEGVLEKLRENPDDKNTIQEAIALAVSYQDQALFDKLAPALASHRLDDADIQAQLGAAYNFFARREEAAAPFQASLKIRDDPEVRRQLGLTLLKQRRPDEAYPYLRHILDEKIADHAGLLFLLVEAYQAEGMHREALELMDRRDEAFPQLASEKDHLKQRKISTRYQHSVKKIRSAYLSESGRAGYREGSWTAKIPRIIGPVVVLGLLIWYLGAAWRLGQGRQVFLVNGWDKPYTVAVNGREQELPPGRAVPLRLPEGEIALEFRGALGSLEPAACRIETPFFSRPFRSQTFVINPDRLAIVLREETEYSEFPKPVRDPAQFHAGEVLYSFRGIDYEFAPFPPSVPIKKGQTVKKTRVSLAPKLSSEARLQLIGTRLDQQHQVDYAKRFLRFDPNDGLILYWLVAKLKDDEAFEFLRPGLTVRPLRIEWHRAYQSRMDIAHPETDLRPEYQRLAAEMKNHPDAVYLWARVQELDEGDKLLRQAATAHTPSANALSALGFRALAEGKFVDAVAWLEKAKNRAPEDQTIRHYFRSALLAAAQYDRLLQELGAHPRPQEENLIQLFEKFQVYVAKGDQAAARAAMDEFLAGPEQAPFREGIRVAMEMVICCHDNDVAGFLQRAEKNPGLSRFAALLLQEKVPEAANAIDLKDNKSAQVQRALVCLAALKADNKTLAEEQWSLLLSSLEKSDRYSRQLAAMLSGRKPLDPELVRRLPIEPNTKRVLVAIAAQKFPAHQKALLPLARTLNFELDVNSLCLRKILED
jgi:hypothetical protein